MNGFRDRRCDKLSTGMMQKTSIARTLVHDPPVMIFDEPTNGLDIMTARTITAFIRECRNNGKTVIFSTHIMSEVEKLCDTIGIIQSGKLLAEGTLAQLRDKYANTISKKSSLKLSLPTSSPRRPTDMSLRNVGIVYRKELTEALRDRRTVISTILVPLLLFPILSVGFGSLAVALVGKAKEEIPKVMLRGGGDSPRSSKGSRNSTKSRLSPRRQTGKTRSSTRNPCRRTDPCWFSG